MNSTFNELKIYTHKISHPKAVDDCSAFLTWHSVHYLLEALQETMMMDCLASVGLKSHISVVVLILTASSDYQIVDTRSQVEDFSFVYTKSVTSWARECILACGNLEGSDVREKL